MTMREATINFIDTAIRLLPFFLLLYLLNSKRTNRRRQFYIPIVAFVYGFALTIVLLRYHTGMEDDGIYRLVQYALGGIFFPVKLVFYLISCLIFRTDNIATKPSELFYYKDKDYDEWFLLDRHVLLRKVFFIVSLIAALLCAVYTTMIRYRGLQARFSGWYFLILPTIALIEIYDYLNGYTKKEYEDRFGGDDSHAARFSNFYKIREVLERTFAREVLTSGTGCEFRERQDILDLLEKMEDGGDRVESTVAEFFKLNGTENVYDTDYIIAVSKMLHGKNVVFYDPFYRDLGKYIILPILNVLLKGKNVLLIVSRRSTQEDMMAWMGELLYKYGRIRDLWRVEKLSEEAPECEVGIISFSQLYDLRLIERNQEFLKDVGFVFFSEPSYILNTGQIGLSVLSQQMEDVEGSPIYCISDRIADGIVDTLSHVLRTEFAEVVAPPVARNIYTSIGWNADGDYLRQRLFGKQTRFLGNGIEIAATAVKNQIPEVYWFGERKAPIRDIKWIAGQYYPAICSYMNQPVQQQSLYDKIKFISNIWCVPEAREQFVIAEDEFMNLFGTMRTFLSRGQEQTFINVLSENYLLRDYMRCNYQMFITDPDAIPSIVPDYVKSERNTLIKLLYSMSYRVVGEDEILHELRLAEVETDDAFHTLTEMLRKYTDADDGIFRIVARKNDSDGVAIQTKSMYSVLKSRFEEVFANTLKTAFYICEDEREDAEYIDAKMFGHVVQSILPGQYVTYEGKYYYVQAISPMNGVILRRASNLYDGRKYYRQIRDYEIDAWTEEAILSVKKVIDIEIMRVCADFTVRTNGYLEMKSYGDLRTARLIDLSSDPQIDAFTRHYRQKSFLMIKLPDTNDNIRYTICMLLSEVLRSVFPDGWAYLAVVTVMPEDIDGMLNHLIYQLSGNVDRDYIYIIEDSEMDLGLLEAVEKNLMRLLEIITDFLGWHFEKMREPAYVDPEIVTPEFPETDYKREKKTADLFKRVRMLSGDQKEEKVDIAEASVVEQASEASETSETSETSKTSNNEADASTKEASDQPSAEEDGFTLGQGGDEPQQESRMEIHFHGDEVVCEVETTADTKPEASGEEQTGEVAKPQPGTPASERISRFTEDQFEPEPDEDPDIVAIDGTDIFDESGSEEDNEYLEECFMEMGIVPISRSRYQNECFLKFGFQEIDKRLSIDDVHKYLTVRGYGKNAYRQARSREEIEEERTLLKSMQRCDFCGLPLSGVSFERLDDGRARCNDCSATAINSLDDLKKIFRQCMTLFENFYGVKMNVDMKVRMTDAKKIAKGYGSVYKPSTEKDVRVLGYALRRGKKYSIYLENGSPRMATITTIVHELTHIWQFRNWNGKRVNKQYPNKRHRDIVYEGMAVWASIQYLYLIGENSYAQKQEAEQQERTDVYGEGFRMYGEKYPISRDSSMIRHSPFMEFPPL